MQSCLTSVLDLQSFVRIVAFLVGTKHLVENPTRVHGGTEPKVVVETLELESLDLRAHCS